MLQLPYAVVLDRHRQTYRGWWSRDSSAVSM